MISAAQLARVQSVLADALQLPEPERDPFVRAHCAADPPILQEVESLLRLHAASGAFLSRPLPELLGAKDLEPAPVLPAGCLIKGRYRIAQLIAESGFATVYLARDETVADKPVVLKVLDRPVDPAAVRLAFDAELQSLSRLQHPGIAGLTDLGHLPDGAPYLVMNYVPGHTLRHLLQQGHLPWPRCRQILHSVGMALAAAHRAGIWHLDVKPENIIVSHPGTPDEHVTLVDFGIAQVKALPSQRAGTSRYMAPEQLDHPSERCDIYALGAVAGEMLTGRPPDAAHRVALPAAIGRALQAHPGDRPATVAEFLQALVPPPPSRYRFAFTAGALLLTIVIAMGLPARLPPPLAWKATPLVTTPGFDYRPALDDAGDWLYYTAGPANQLDIYRQSTRGGAPLPVVLHPADDEHPAPSPDGHSLAFVRGFPHESILMLKSLPTGAEVELAHDREIGSLAWHPDGRHLIVSRGTPDTDGRNHLDWFDTTARRFQPLIPSAPGTRGDRYPTVAPHGKSIAFVRRFQQESSDLFVVQLNASLQATGHPRRITAQNERIQNVQFTPDGRHLIYTAGPLGRAVLFRVAATGGTPERLLGLDENVELVTIARRAWKLAYSVHRSDSNIRRHPIAQPTADQDPVLMPSTYDDEEPHLAPDGRWIAYSSGRSGSEQIWLASVDGESPRQITAIPGADAMSVLWSRDSRQLIISVRKKGPGQRVYVTSADGPSQLVPILNDARATEISHDGRWLYIVRTAAVPKRIWRTPYPPAAPLLFEPVTAGPAEVARESPDGRSLYFTRRNEADGIWHQPLPHGPATRIVDQLYRRNFFVPARNGVYYIARSGLAPTLFFRTLTGETRRLVTFQHDLFWGLDLSPDERSLYYSRFDVGNADIMLVSDFAPAP